MQLNQVKYLKSSEEELKQNSKMQNFRRIWFQLHNWQMIEQNDPAYILHKKSTPITSTTEESNMYYWMRKNMKNASQSKFSIIQFRPT